MLRLHYFPLPFVDYQPSRRDLIRRGTEYGGWWFDPEALGRGALVVSAGAGEDISFDIAVASEFDAEVIIIDPTPRAVAHVEETLARVGLPAGVDFVPGGRQSPFAYDLTTVRKGQITLLPFALWEADGELSFHPPLDPEHVSYSVDDWRRNGINNAGSPQPLCVAARKLSSLLPDGELFAISLLKIDIEGAEIEVIEDTLNSGCRPVQFLV
jgi:FkbM family methyltransferase